MGCGPFVDWDKMPELDQQSSAHSQILPTTSKELKKLAREGHWATNHALRARAYHQIIQHIPCRLVTPDAQVYRDVASKLFGKQSVSSHPLPEFLGGSAMPAYCLTVEGVTAVKKILICLGNLFPDITYSPHLPAIVALLLHYSEDEAHCFENVSRLVSCSDSHTSYIDQSFLAHEASCMTFGDLANKHCQAAHRFIASTSENVFEIYSEWLVWIFSDLPFDYTIRVLDVYLLEGQKVLYRIALALLRQYRLSVTSRDQEVTNARGDLKAFMQNIREHMTADKLLERAFGIRLFSRKEIWLLQMANRKALVEKGITVVQRRRSFHLAVDMLNFSSAIVTAQEMRTVWSWIPERFSLFPPILLFSTLENGYSLQRYSDSRKLRDNGPDPQARCKEDSEKAGQRKLKNGEENWQHVTSRRKRTYMPTMQIEWPVQGASEGMNRTGNHQVIHPLSPIPSFWQTEARDTSKHELACWAGSKELTKDCCLLKGRFYSCCEGYEPTVLLIKTKLGEVCGAFLSSDWNERKKNGGMSSFFGTGECFVFSVRPEMERYEWVFIKKPELTKAVPRSPRRHSPSPPSPAPPRTRPIGHVASSNHLTVPVLQRAKGRLSPFLATRHFLLPSKTASMFMSGTQEGIVIGGGAGQALYIDADLYHGRTEHCETFDNPPLCQENFQVQLLEAWGFQNP